MIHKTIEVKFYIDEKVKIKPLERFGKVISIWITNRGINYECRYFDNAEAKTVNFYEDEIELVNSIPLEG